MNTKRLFLEILKIAHMGIISMRKRSEFGENWLEIL